MVFQSSFQLKCFYMVLALVCGCYTEQNTACLSERTSELGGAFIHAAAAVPVCCVMSHCGFEVFLHRFLVGLR